MRSTLARGKVTPGRPRWLLLPLLACVLLLASGCASLGPAIPRQQSQAINQGEADRTGLGRALSAQAATYPGLSGFQLLLNGQAAFEARVALADGAERTLDLQYYSVGEDLTTDLLLARIVQAAKRGVRVRILLDDVHPSARNFARRAVAAHSGIQVRMFNAFLFGGTSSLARLGEFIFDGGRLNRRMHNKLWLTDNAAAITGSRNLADEYFSANASFNFYDVDLLAAGPIVSELSRAFDTYWNSMAAIPIEALATLPDADEAEVLMLGLQARTADCDGAPACHWLDHVDLLVKLRSATVPLTWARAQLFYDQPDQDKSDIASGIEHGSIDDNPGGVRTASELLIMSPYFIPSEMGRQHLRDMRRRGVRIAVLTNSLSSTDSTAAHAAYARYRWALLSEGVELYEVRPESRLHHPFKHRWGHASESSLHAKVTVQDRSRAIVGSLNQDPRSRLHNTEAWIAIESTELSADLVTLFEEGIDLQHAFKLGTRETEGGEGLTWRSQDGGEVVEYEEEPMSSQWRKIWRDLLGALIPEHLL